MLWKNELEDACMGACALGPAVNDLMLLRKTSLEICPVSWSFDAANILSHKLINDIWMADVT